MADTPPLFEHNLPFETGETLHLNVNAPDSVVNVPTNSVSGAKLEELQAEDASSNESENETAGPSSAATGELNRTKSPPPNCAICLSRCKDKCFTESCLHHFCFKCLCEWSKIKPECPLCKQSFKSIIHNVRAMGDFDRYHVQPNPQMPERPLTARFLWSDRPNVVIPLLRQPLVHDRMEGDSIRNRYEPYRSELLTLYRQERDAALTGSLSQLWRRYIYDRKLYALPVSDITTGQYREWSARFYRYHPAQIHRLMPWINRDIVCLLRNTSHSVTEVLTLVNSMLPLSNMLGPSFRRQLSPFLGNQTTHFIHELFNFARSPYDMIGYDRVVQYSAQLAQEVTIDFTSSDEEQQRVQNNSNNNNNNANTDDTRSANGSNINSSTNNNNNNNNNNNSNSTNRTDSRRTQWSSTVIVSNPYANEATHSLSVSQSTNGSGPPVRAIQSAAMNLSIHSRVGDIIEIEDNDTDAAANAEVAAINNSNSNSSSSQTRRHAGAEMPVTAHIELNSSDSSQSDENDNNGNNRDSSDCEFVLELKPPHLRTPELVSLNSESDSDCVFVPSTTNQCDKASKEKKNVEQSKNTVNEAESNLFLGASTSTGLSGGPENHWRAEYIRQMTKSNAIRKKRDSKRSSKRLKKELAAKQKVQESLEFESTSTSSISSDSDSDSDSSHLLSTSASDTESNGNGRNLRKRRRSTRNIKGERGLKSAKHSNSNDQQFEVKEEETTRKRRSTASNKITPEKRKKHEETPPQKSSSDVSGSSDSDNSDVQKESLRAMRVQRMMDKAKFHREICDTSDSNSSASTSSSSSTSSSTQTAPNATNHLTRGREDCQDFYDTPDTLLSNSSFSNRAEGSEYNYHRDSDDSIRDLAIDSLVQHDNNDNNDDDEQNDHNGTTPEFNHSDLDDLNNKTEDDDVDDVNNKSDDDDVNNKSDDDDVDDVNNKSDDDDDDDDDVNNETDDEDNFNSNKSIDADNTNENENNESNNESHSRSDNTNDNNNTDNGNDEDENDSSMLNPSSAPATRNYGNSLEEEALFSIYSDVSSAVSSLERSTSPIPNRNISEDVETADIDVCGIDSFL